VWIVFNDAFLSAVRHRTDPNILTVRARRRQDLERYFPGHPIDEGTPTNDYPFRVFVQKAAFAAIVGRYIGFLGYGNFKDSIAKSDHELKKFAIDVWTAGLKLEPMDHWKRTADHFGQTDFLGIDERDQDPLPEWARWEATGKSPIAKNKNRRKNRRQWCSRCDSNVTNAQVSQCCQDLRCPLKG
jgi:hypothetical protein